MVGLIIFAHNGLADHFVSALRDIVGPQEQLAAVNVETSSNSDEVERKLDHALQTVDKGDGVIILADLFGGSPANFSLARLVPGKVEVISGLNLAMLLKAFDLRDRNLSDPTVMARAIAREGKDNIVLASQILKQKHSQCEVR